MSGKMNAGNAAVVLLFTAFSAGAEELTIDSGGVGNAIGFLQGFNSEAGKQAILDSWAAQQTGGSGLVGYSATGFASGLPANAPTLAEGETAPSFWSADHASELAVLGVTDQIAAWMDAVVDQSGNIANLLQTGDNNSAVGFQAGHSNTSSLTQSGAFNEAASAQAVNGGQSSIDQAGSGNTGYTAQVGDIVATSTILQTGDENRAALVQVLGDSTASGGLSTAAISQTGDANLASVVAEGTTDAAGLTIGQVGTGSIAMLSTYGNDNRADVTQASSGFVNLYIDGHHNEVDLVQGDASDAVISLVGNLNLLDMTQNGAGGFGSVSVLGNGNDMTVLMAGSGGYAELDIDGNDNLVAVAQTADATDAIAAITIGGNTNTVDLTQSAANTTASVTIVNVSNRNDVTISQSVAGATADVTVDGNRNTYQLAQHNVATVVIAEIDGNRSYQIEQY